MRRIAGWNSARDVWETDQVDVISQRSDVYSETLPISGSMRNGVVYELPTSAPHMDGSGSLFSQLGGKILPTPAASVANDGEGPETWLARRERVKAQGINGNGMGMPLTIAVQLLKTPTAQLAINGGSQHPGERKAGGHGPTLADEVEHLLPTPMTSDTQNPASGDMRRNSPGLRAVKELLPTPTAERPDARKSASFSEGRATFFEIVHNNKWGAYAAAVARWESVIGRQAPDPTELGPKGGRRLSAVFVEWMMGLPEGWVTDPELGLSRTQQLKMLGNGVVTQQAVAALAAVR